MYEQYTKDYQDQAINEQYKIWKKNAPMLYSMVMVYQMDQSVSSIQWLPQKNNTLESDFTVHKCLAAISEQRHTNYILILKVKIPVDLVECNLSDQSNCIEIDTKIINDGPITRCRYNPQKYNIVAAKTTHGDIFIYDYSQHPNKPVGSISRPELKLAGHSDKGFGLAWSPKKSGLLLSGSFDGKVCLWSIQESIQNKQSLRPFLQINNRDGQRVYDVNWSKHQLNLLGYCGGKGLLSLYDLRSKGELPFLQKKAHKGSIYSLDFSPFNQFLLLTSSEDRQISLWDTRNFTKRLHSFEGHNQAINKVQWNPNLSNIFCSASLDRRCIIWDISKSNSLHEGQSEQMLFIHGGHRTQIRDFSWNANESWLVCSIQSDRILNIWEPVDGLR